MKRLPASALSTLLCSAGLCFAAEPQDTPEPPACTKEIQGRFWPAEANSNHELARKLYQSGELRMCSLVQSKYTIYWKFKWQQVSVNARDLAKGVRRQDSRDPAKVQPAENTQDSKPGAK